MLVFISANQKANSYCENVVSNANMYAQLGDLGYKAKQVLGVYNGLSELSFKVFCDKEYVEELLLLSIEYNQECILVMEDDGTDCHLLFPDMTSEELGVMQEVTKEQAEALGNYTIEDGKYYSC